jgi:hypothetical protein
MVKNTVTGMLREEDIKQVLQTLISKEVPLQEPAQSFNVPKSLLR